MANVLLVSAVSQNFTEFLRILGIDYLFPCMFFTCPLGAGMFIFCPRTQDCSCSNAATILGKTRWWDHMTQTQNVLFFLSGRTLSQPPATNPGTIFISVDVSFLADAHTDPQPVRRRGVALSWAGARRRRGGVG